MATETATLPTSRSRARAARELADILDADLFAALCEPVRVEIIRFLTARGRSDIATVADHVAPDRSVVSRHLSTLSRAGIVRREKEGRNVYFELDGPRIVARMEAILEKFKSVVPLCCPGTRR